MESPYKNVVIKLGLKTVFQQGKPNIMPVSIKPCIQAAVTLCRPTDHDNMINYL